MAVNYPKMFKVIDKQTGKIADERTIARKEKWAKELMSMDMDGFAIDEYGDLILMDECGRYVSCPCDRFKIVWNPHKSEAG
jgi:hypothetical protein